MSPRLATSSRSSSAERGSDGSAEERAGVLGEALTILEALITAADKHQATTRANLSVVGGLTIRDLGVTAPPTPEEVLYGLIIASVEAAKLPGLRPTLFCVNPRDAVAPIQRYLREGVPA